MPHQSFPAFSAFPSLITPTRTHLAEGGVVPACYECSFADETSEPCATAASLVLATHRFSAELSASASTPVAASLALDPEADPVVISSSSSSNPQSNSLQDGLHDGQQHARGWQAPKPPGSPLAARAKALVAAAAALRAAESPDEAHDTSMVGGKPEGEVGRGKGRRGRWCQ